MAVERIIFKAVKGTFFHGCKKDNFQMKDSGVLQFFHGYKRDNFQMKNSDVLHFS